jgi:hypothetical protein
MDSPRSAVPEVREIPQMWYRPSTAELGPGSSSLGPVTYRPAALVESRLSFRSFRAGFQYSDERYFTAWYPTRHVTIDWSDQAVQINRPEDLNGIAHPHATYKSADYDFSAAYFEELLEELIDHLVRTSKYSVLHNANFNLYSEPRETREEFLARCREAGIEKIEPEMKRMLSKFELAIEQLREAQSRRGRKLEGEKAEDMFAYWRNIFAASEKGLADMFLGKFQLVLENPIARQMAANEEIDQELVDEIGRVEKDAREAVNSLYTDYIRQVEQCDKFEVGLQRENIHIQRRALLWVPFSAN